MRRLAIGLCALAVLLVLTGLALKPDGPHQRVVAQAPPTTAPAPIAIGAQYHPATTTTTTTLPPQPPTTQRTYRARTTQRPSYAAGGCDGQDPVPCCIVMRESHGQWNARNPSSGAGGRYQMLPSTFHNTAAGAAYGGNAADAPPDVQRAAAAELVRRQGLAPWAGPGC